jgi:Fe-S-cluster-containing dehydrogenase component
MTALPDGTARKLGLLTDLDVCIGCNACAVACNAWNGGERDDGADGRGELPGADTAGESAPAAARGGTGRRTAGGGGPAAAGGGAGHGTPATATSGRAAPGPWFVEVFTFEVRPRTGAARIVHFPKSCLHCADAPCVTVCPTGASHKRVEDGIVLLDPDTCIGCGLCAWACPYGACTLDRSAGVMRKCTLCADRIDDQGLPQAERVPVCVTACPTGARLFGDLGDPDSTVSRLAGARGGYDLMPEQETRPVNKYLPQRQRDTLMAQDPIGTGGLALAALAEPEARGFLGWLDTALGALEQRSARTGRGDAL